MECGFKGCKMTAASTGSESGPSTQPTLYDGTAIPTSIDEPLMFPPTPTLPATATATEAVSSQGATEAVADPTPASTSSPSPAEESSPRRGLSTGAKAGAAVGSIIGFALLALLALFLLKKRKKQKQQAPLLSGERKHLGGGPSTMSHQDPYSDSPANGANPTRFSWAPPAPPPAAPAPPAGGAGGGGGGGGGGGVAEIPLVQQPYGGDQPYGIQPASRDIAGEEATAGFWQQSAGHSPVSPQNRNSDIAAAPRTSLQESRVPGSPAQQGRRYSGYIPSAQAATSGRASRAMEEEDWEEDERRLEAEIAEIERMRQVREERAAMR